MPIPRDAARSLFDDPEGAILPYDAIVLVAARRANDPLLRRALATIGRRHSRGTDARGNYRVDRDTDM
jgi:osmoprotectant transport system permease protein